MEGMDGYYRSQMGMQVRMPNRFVMLSFLDSGESTKRSWAERKRDKLIWRIKKRIALRNQVIKVVLKIMTVPLAIFIAMLVGYTVYVTWSLHVNGIVMGILLAEIIIICVMIPWFTIDDSINSDPDRVKIRR